MKMTNKEWDAIERSSDPASNGHRGFSEICFVRYGARATPEKVHIEEAYKYIRKGYSLLMRSADHSDFIWFYPREVIRAYLSGYGAVTDGVYYADPPACIESTGANEVQA